jgi:peptidoglycan/LPS O-acetylase OafA/YrhL
MFLLMMKGGPRKHLLLCAICAAVLAVRGRIPAIDNRAALPLVFEFFFLGGFSYAVYCTVANLPKAAKERVSFLLIAVVLAGAVFSISGKSRHMVSICGWIVFLGLLVETGQKGVAPWLVKLFDNPVAQFLGRISYRLYLSHWIVIIVAQAIILNLWPNLSQAGHFTVLLGFTAVGTIAVSYLTYLEIEVPGIRLGRQLTTRKSRPVLAPTALTRPS